MAGLQKQKDNWLLKAAEVNLDDLMTQSVLEQTLQRYDFSEIEVVDLSKAVLYGFSHYIQRLPPPQFSLDAVKIQITAKLCHKLYVDGLVQYVQISAKKNAP